VVGHYFEVTLLPAGKKTKKGRQGMDHPSFKGWSKNYKERGNRKKKKVQSFAGRPELPGHMTGGRGGEKGKEEKKTGVGRPTSSIPWGCKTEGVREKTKKTGKKKKKVYS